MADHPTSYAALRGLRKANPMLVYALDRTGLRPGRALDIGAGAFGETRLLLDHGFTVDAVDPDPVSQELSRTVEDGAGRFTAVHTRIQDFPISEGAYCLILALHVLPFLRADDLADVAGAITRGLQPGGVLCCSLLGERDSWARVSVTPVTECGIAALFAGLRPLYHAEVEFDGSDAEGKRKHWHVFRQVLVKPS